MHSCYFFFFNDTATTEIYTLSLHDALPIYLRHRPEERDVIRARGCVLHGHEHLRSRPRSGDRKSTRLNSSHSQISYAVFCLKKKIEAVLAICMSISMITEGHQELLPFTFTR